MNIRTSGTAQIELEVSIDGRDIKTHPCDIGDWWGEYICRQVDFNEILTEVGLPKGEYKMVITLEKL